jgi:Glycosyltransferase
VLPRPAALQGITQKIIGYTGSIEYRSDFELLKKVAEYHKDKILFFVGPVQGNEHREVGLDTMPNVIFAGARKITELPYYLQYFDCVLIPFRKNTLTRSIYPLKINEYLAAGKPVIATHFSEDIYTFRDVAYVTDTHEEFIQAIDKAIAENSEEKKMRACVWLPKTPGKQGCGSSGILFPLNQTGNADMVRQEMPNTPDKMRPPDKPLI